MSGHPAVEFLTATLARAEGTARAATRGPWKARHRSDGRHSVIGGAHPLPGAETDNRVVHRDDGYPSDSEVVHPAADADHIALHDPAAVLRLVAGARKILAEHRPAKGYPEGLSGYGKVCGTCARADRDGELWGDAWPCRTVLLLAQAWGWEEEHA